MGLPAITCRCAFSVLPALLLLTETSSAGAKTDVSDKDPLPVGAVARFGSSRFRTDGWSDAAALSPDGKTLASADRTGIALIDLESGKRSLQFKEDGVLLLAFLDQGKTLVSANDRGHVRFWSIATGKELRQPLQVLSKDANRYYEEAALSLNGLLAISDEVQVSVWDLDKQKRLHKFNLSLDEGPLALSPDGKTIAALDKGGNLVLWDAASGKRKTATKNNNAYLQHLRFSPDGKMLVSYGTYHTYRVWDVRTLSEKCAFGRPEKNEFAMAFSPDSRLLATTHDDGYMRVWELLSSKEISKCRLLAEGFRVVFTSIHFSPDCKKLITSGDAVVRVWDVLTGRELTTNSGPQHAAAALTASADGKALAGVYGDTLRVWDVRSKKERFHLTNAAWPIAAVFSRDHGRIAYAHEDHSVRVCDAVSGGELAKLQGHSKEVTSVSYSADGKTIFTASQDATLRAWDAATGKEKRRHLLETPRFENHDNSRYDTLSSDGQTLTIRYFWTAWVPQTDPGRAPGWTYNHRVRHYSTKTGERMFGEYQTPVLSVLVLAPDGRTFAGIGQGGTLEVFDTASGKAISHLRAAPKDNPLGLGFSSSLAYSPDGQLLAASGVDGNGIEVWDIKARKRVHTMPHRVRSAGLAFVGDNLLASSDPDTTIILWNILKVGTQR